MIPESLNIFVKTGCQHLKSRRVNVNESEICSFPVTEGRNANACRPQERYNSARLSSPIIFHSTGCCWATVGTVAGGGASVSLLSLCLWLSVSVYPTHHPAVWLIIHTISPVSQVPLVSTKEGKLLGEFFCKLRTTARFIVILTMIQESLDHHWSGLILWSVMTEVSSILSLSQ